MDDLDTLVQQLLSEVAEAASSEALHRLEVCALGSKGVLQAQLRSIGSLPREARPAFGARVNEAKQRVLQAIEARRTQVEQLEAEARVAAEALDITLPGDSLPAGGLHPLSHTVRRIKQTLIGLGFEFVDGPELEEYQFNFASLNYPEDHPAFDEQMTFYVDETRLLRTQTTALQGRVMAKRRPPFRIATVGRCHRYEAVDATHHHTFHQVDAFMVDRGVSMAHLKGTLKQFASRMFGGELRLRFRPDFFPFVEPGVDYAIWWEEKWLELGGAGLIHPNILEAHGIDSETYSGFAFGLGIERIHMIQKGVKDLRYYLENDLRFLRQR